MFTEAQQGWRTVPRRFAAAMRSLAVRIARRLSTVLGSGPLARTLQSPAVRAVRSRLNRIDAKDVLVVVTALRVAGIETWLAGGWAVDAIVGKSTRRHKDLDLLVPEHSVEDVAPCLARLGFELIRQTDLGSGYWMPVRFLFRDSLGHYVDVHPIRMVDGSLHAVRGPGSLTLPLTVALTSGHVNNHAVPCLSPAAQLAFKFGYAWDGDDVRDAEVLRRYAQGGIGLESRR